MTLGRSLPPVTVATRIGILLGSFHQVHAQKPSTSTNEPWPRGMPGRYEINPCTDKMWIQTRAFGGYKPHRSFPIKDDKYLLRNNFGRFRTAKKAQVETPKTHQKKIPEPFYTALGFTSSSSAISVFLLGFFFLLLSVIPNLHPIFEPKRFFREGLFETPRCWVFFCLQNVSRVWRPPKSHQKPGFFRSRRSGKEGPMRRLLHRKKKTSHNWNICGRNPWICFFPSMCCDDSNPVLISCHLHKS